MKKLSRAEAGPAAAAGGNLGSAVSGRGPKAGPVPSVSRPGRLALRVMLAGLLLMGLRAEALSAQSPGVEFFQKGQYSAAYAALWPEITAGNPEAAFYGLVIRRNGLDGRPPAEAKEISALWNILLTNADLMRWGLKESSTPQGVRDAYRTALAQLDYFGPTPPSWPPGRADDQQRQRAGEAAKALAGLQRRFSPAMNFLAYLELNAYEKRQSQAFRLTLRAAESGDHLAMANLAWLYREGLGERKNNLRAAHWARQGAGSVPPLPRAQNELGYCYEAGLGVSQDQTEAARWYEGAAKQSYGPGRANAARLKAKGKNQSAGPSLESGLFF